uniref:ATP synthase complex subunit 8 n=1 Tax=Rheocricotopus villiculus TaxID=2781637 RepID=A0A8A9WMP0_9DIPT|nr:ATP synthase F0 subunit 8 [Rheocricotopus villiculus]QTT60909.1 ATP synthase F0 subunit 8 [Rheocricotopus villiculus]
MPQMAPISWLTLFVIFSISFMIFNMLNYYCFYNKINLTSKNEVKLNKTLNWKW